MIRAAILTALPLLVLLGACQSAPPPPIATVGQLDLRRFMGRWYVIANIPTFIEKTAHNAVETYALRTDGAIATTFSFRDGAFDGPRKQYRPTGFVRDDSNAVWGMQFLWPFEAEYRVLYVDADYRRTVIGRSQRDYVWLMARDPQLSPDDYGELVAVVAAAGYDVARIRKVPQRWPEAD